MTAASLSNVLEVAETDRNTFNYMKRAKLLRSKIGETTPGVPTPISRRAALEIAFVSALAGAGLKLSDASDRANAEFFARTKEIRGDLFYAVNPRTGFGFYFSDKNMPMALLRNQLADRRHGGGWSHEAPALSPTVISIIDLAELVRRVDGLFEN